MGNLFVLLILCLNTFPRVHENKQTNKLTKLYSSLFPRSSSSSLWSIESDLWMSHGREERGSAPVVRLNTICWHIAFILQPLNTYSGRNVSRFSLSSSDAKLERLQQKTATELFSLWKWHEYTPTTHDPLTVCCVDCKKEKKKQIAKDILGIRYAGAGSVLEACLCYQGW